MWSCNNFIKKTQDQQGQPVPGAELCSKYAVDHVDNVDAGIPDRDMELTFSPSSLRSYLWICPKILKSWQASARMLFLLDADILNIYPD